VKRSPLPPRRKPLARSGWLNRGKSLNRRSKRKAREIRESRPVVAAVRERDGGCVLRDVHACWGPLDPHHLRKQSQGGKWTEQNLVCLCRAGNGWVEDHPRAAHHLGLVVRDGEPVWWAWDRMVRADLPVTRPPCCRDSECATCGGAA
jgi:hypothetical protein